MNLTKAYYTPRNKTIANIRMPGTGWNHCSWTLSWNPNNFLAQTVFSQEKEALKIGVFAQCFYRLVNSRALSNRPLRYQRRYNTSDKTLHVAKHSAAKIKIFLSFLKRPRSDTNILERRATFKLITRGSKEVTQGQDPMSTGESRAWQLCRRHPYRCMVLGKSLYIQAPAPKRCSHWLAETHVGVRRVRRAGAALHRQAANTELPHRQPQGGGARDSPGRVNFPRRVAPQHKPAPRDPACLRSRRSAPRLTSPRPAPRR